MPHSFIIFWRFTLSLIPVFSLLIPVLICFNLILGDDNWQLA